MTSNMIHEMIKGEKVPITSKKIIYEYSIAEIKEIIIKAFRHDIIDCGFDIKLDDYDLDIRFKTSTDIVTGVEVMVTKKEIQITTKPPPKRNEDIQ